MKAFASVLTSLWLALAPTGAAAQATDFIRVEEDAEAARLQTAITRYENANGTTVDLIGAIHVADAAYYKTLEERFGRYNSVLFEMVADADALPNNAAGASATQDKQSASTRQLYSMLAKLLGLATQTDSIDYTKSHFVHADLSLSEFKRLQTEKGQSVLDLMSKASTAPAASQPDMARLVQAMLSGSTDRMKLEIVHTLGSGDDQIRDLVGDDSVLIGDRNARCIEVLETELEKQPKEVAIFYGAAHFPDMEERLVAKGFVKQSQEWLTAWNVPKSSTSPKPVELQQESTNGTGDH